MTRARRLVRWSASSLVALLVLLVIGVGITQTAWFRNWVRMQLVARATAALDGELRVSRLGGSLWTGVTLDNVEVWHRGGRVLSADRIRVAYNPWSLLRRQWIIDRVVIDRAEIGVAETSEGWNILRLTRAPKQAREAPALIAIRRLELSDTDVTVATKTGAARRITDVTMDGSVRVEHGVMAVRVDEFTGYDEATGLTVRELSGHASDNFRSFRAEVLADSPTTRIEGVVSGATTAAGRTVDASLDIVGLDLRRLTGDRRLASNITGHVVALGTLPAGKPAHATFAFSGGRNTALGYTADVLDATGSVNRDRVTFDARVTAYGARANVAGTWRFGRNRTAGDFAGRGTFARVDLRRLPATWRLPALESALAGRFDVTTGRGGWRAHATLDASVVEGARVAAGTEGSVTMAGGVTRYAAIGGVQDLNLQRLGGPIRIQRFAEPRFASDLNGRFYVAGHEAATSPRLVFGGAVLEDSTFSGTHLPSLTATAYLSDRTLTVEARGAFDDLNPTTLGTRASMALDGSVNGWFVVHDLDQPWTEHNIEGDGLVVLKDSVIENVAIDAGTIDGRLADGVATVRTIDLRGPDASLRVDGALGLDTAVPNSGLTVTADVPDLSGIGRHLGRPLTGSAAIQATVTGTAMSPSASGDVTLQQAAYGNAVSALTSTTRFNAAWPDRQSDEVTWDATTDATFVQVGNTKLQHLAATVAGSLREMNVDIRAEQQGRSLGVEGRVTLLPDSRELLLRRLALTTQNVAWSLPAGQTAAVRYGTDTIDVSDLTLVRGEQQIDVSGSFWIGASETAPAPGRAASLDVVIRGVELNDVNQALLGTRQLSGRLDGTITVSGTRQSPTVDAQIVARDGTVEGVPFAMVDSRGRYRDRRLTFDVTLDQAPGAQLKATGTMPVGAAAGADGLDVAVTGGPFNVGLIQALTTEIDNVSGSATLDVRITGSTAAPSVDGKVAIAGGAFNVHATGARYQNLDADLTFAGSHLTIGRLQVGDADGDLLTAEGGLDVLGEFGRRAVDVRVRAQKFGVLRNRFGNADVDVDLGVTGTLSALTVRGSAELDSGRLEVAEILERTTSTPYSTTPQAPLDAKTPAAERPGPSLLDSVNIDVQLRLPDNLVLRGRGLRVSNGGFGIGDMNIVTGGSFDVRKPPGADVEVLGTLQVVRGSYTFQGRRFDIVGGSDVRFRGGPLSDPSLNVSATREVSGITAEVRLRGTARSPQVTIASQPPLDEGDILSLIVFNQPINSLGAAERVNLGERAASMAAGAIASPLADSIARALNLDMLEIQAPTSEQSAGAVTVGGRLGSRLFVGLRQQFGRDESSLLTLEYRVNEVLRFVTSVARGTLQAHATRRMDQGGVDLIFVIRY